MRTKLFSLLTFTALFASEMKGQNVGINATGVAPAASAILDLTSATTGLLIPRVALTATNMAAPVVAPAVSLLVYNTATAGAAPNNVIPGFYYWNGAAWIQFATGTTGWTTIGNFGTSPASNWIGTNDANDWAIKTGGTAATNERARFLTAGQVVVNNTGVGLNTNDVFSVYGTGTTNGVTGNTSALGLRAISGYTSTGFGVFGNATGTTTTSFGLYGLANATTGAANGVRGEAGSNATSAIIGIGNTSGAAIAAATNARGVAGQVNGTTAGTGIGMGVSGITAATMTTGDARGVYGQTASDNGAGTFGFATTTAVTAFPVGALGIASTNTGFGAEGFNSSATGTGVLGEGNNLAGLFLTGGSGGAFTGTATGSFAYATTVASGTGVIGVGNGGATVNVLAGGSGGAFTGATTGAYAVAAAAATGTGVIGVGNNALPGMVLVNGSGGAFKGTTTGSYGVATTVANGTGVVGVGNNAGATVLGGGSGGAFSGTTTGVYGKATSNLPGAAGAPARAGGYFESGTAVDAFTYVACMEGAGVPRKVMGNGTVNTVVKNERDEYVLLSAPEAPENLFQDYGTGQLVNGRAHVRLDPTLSRNILVNEEHPLRAFVQLRGDCHGVYVTNETAEGFDVVELNGGTSSISFFWTVTANRANQVRSDGSVWHFAEERFAHTMGPQITHQAQSQNMVAPSENPSLIRKKDQRSINPIPVPETEPTPVVGSERGQ